MLFHEAKVIAHVRVIPGYLREEAKRVVALHSTLDDALRIRVGRGRHIKDGRLAEEFVTTDPVAIARINKILICNLLLACDNRSWLPARGTWV